MQKEIKAITKARKRARIAVILEQFRGLKFIAGIKANGKRNHIGAVLDNHGELQNNRDDIVNVFADFYADLYRTRECNSPPHFVLNDIVSERISLDDVRKQLHAMASRKAADSKGIVAELLKHSSDKLLEAIALLFEDVVKPQAMPPESWKQTRLKVLFKKGDPRNVENYRPISVLPILYKLFSKVICAKIRVILDRAQSVDQGGFRSGFACDDHLFALTLLSEKCSEFRLPLWTIYSRLQEGI